MNAKVILLIVGLLIGGAAGWLTAPAPALNVDIGPVSVEVQEGTGEGGSVTATGEDGQIKVQVGQRSWLDDRTARAAVFAIVGAIIGFGAGLVTDRRKV
jgi:F0F1-type ATP synthase assembly protein I